MDLFRNIFRRKAYSLTVLMYHRIADMSRDPWQLGVSPNHFEQQLRMLRNEFEIVSISEIMGKWRNKDFSTPAVSITFDDAYADNFEAAAPLLKKYACPASFFVPTAFLNNQLHFWWDELEACLLHSFSLPEKLYLNIGGSLNQFTFRPGNLTEEESKQQNRWNYDREFPTDRCQNFYRIWELLKPLVHEEIEVQLDIIRNWAGITIQRLQPIPRIMNRAELSLIAEEPLFSIGVHTRNHPALAFHSRDFQEIQIAGCKADLEQLLRRKISSIAYPYGNYNDDTLEITSALDFEAGFTTEANTLNQCTDPLKAGRIAVTNMNGNELRRKISPEVRNTKYERHEVRSEK